MNSEKPKSEVDKSIKMFAGVCVLIIAVFAVYLASCVMHSTQHENSSLEMASIFEAANSEEDVLIEKLKAVCKKYNIPAKISSKKQEHHTSYSDGRDEEKCDIYITVITIRPDEVKDWWKLYDFINEAKALETGNPLIGATVAVKYSNKNIESKTYHYFTQREDDGLAAVKYDGGIRYVGFETSEGRRDVSEIMPYKGMPEAMINLTKLGVCSDFSEEKTFYSKQFKRTYYYRTYYWYGKYRDDPWGAVYTVEVKDGYVVSVKYKPENEKPESKTSSSGGSYSASANRPVTTTKKAYYDDDPYNARDFADPEDFYDYYYDDFEDYEEAYDYFYEHNPD